MLSLEILLDKFESFSKVHIYFKKANEKSFIYIFLLNFLQGDDGSQDVATSLAAAAAAAAAVAAAAQQQSQPNPCVTQTDSHNQSVVQSLATAAQHQNKADNTPKRLHVSNIPFRFRDPDLRNMFGVSFSFG